MTGLYARQGRASSLLALIMVSLALSGCSFNEPFPAPAKPRQTVIASPPVIEPPVTPPVSAPSVHPPAQVYRIEVLKASRTLRVWQGSVLVVSYGIALGANPVDPKRCQGDQRTPEGVYTVTERKANSAFYRALRLSYPQPDDVARARALGCKPGSAIMIHGLPNGRGYIGSAHRQEDWTDGCIAVTNQEMDHLWRLISVGTHVEIHQ